MLTLVIAAPILVNFLSLGDRVRAFYYIVMLTAMLFCMNVTKLIYH